MVMGSFLMALGLGGGLAVVVVVVSLSVVVAVVDLLIVVDLVAVEEGRVLEGREEDFFSRRSLAMRSWMALGVAPVKGEGEEMGG